MYNAPISLRKKQNQRRYAPNIIFLIFCCFSCVAALAVLAHSFKLILGCIVCIAYMASMSVLDTRVIRAETAKPIEMSFEALTRVGPRNHVRRRSKSPRNGPIFGVV